MTLSLTDNITDRPHPWQSARDEFDSDVLPWLKEHGRTIGAESATNPIAGKIISYYSMLYKSFDPMTLVLLREAIKEYNDNKI